MQVNNAAVGGFVLDYEALGDAPFDNLLDEQTQLFKSVRQTYENAIGCININYTGTRRVTEFITNEGIKQELQDVDSLTEGRLDEIFRSFLEDFHEAKLIENGWPTSFSAYKVSKVLVSAYTRILAKRYPNFCINCVCPGFLKTDLSYNTGVLTVEESAKWPVMLALLPDGGPSGVFFNQSEASSFD